MQKKKKKKKWCRHGDKALDSELRICRFKYQVRQQCSTFCSLLPLSIVLCATGVNMLPRKNLMSPFFHHEKPKPLDLNYPHFLLGEMLKTKTLQHVF